ncbi:MAG: acyl-CoA dehydrogenase family protein [Deltaproteobacteria bacterium]|nr:acyl-CoA dehydrogenase family protein [Deltaproteobacteria bacterium]
MPYYNLDQAQQERVQMVSQFAQTRLSPGAREREAAAAFNRELWTQASSFGLTGLPFPEQFGGSNLNALDTMVIIEALGKHCEDSGLIFSLCAHMFAASVPIWRAQNEMTSRYLPSFINGTHICANAITEPEAGSDVFALKTLAVRDGDQYIINGSKCFVTNAPIADYFLIYATTDPARGFLGISAFLLPRETAGLQVQAELNKTGLRTSPWGTVYLNDCRVSAKTRLGAEGCGAALFHESMIWERGCLFAFYVGYMERTLEQCIDYARTRKQFGRVIGENQSIQNRIVDMKLRLETSRALLYRAGELHRDGKHCEEAISLAKLWISEAAVQSGSDAVQIFGGFAMITATGVDSLLRDALPARVFSGSSEMQRILIAKSLGL